MPEILVLCPQERDVRALGAAGLGAGYRVRFVGRDLDAADPSDPADVLDEADGIAADGVVGTKDRSALLAAVLARRRRLPGPTPEALFACQHKPTSRAIQRDVAPAATPRFALLNGLPPRFGPPWFVKPVVGRLSRLARRVDGAVALPAFDARDSYQAGYAGIARLAGLPADLVHGYLAEELVEGAEVTLEGYVYEGRVTTIGITDSVKYEGTDSFERFEYPSALPEARKEELAGIAERLLPALGFDGGFFNVEFLVPDDGPAWLIEVNGRLASQFAPLVQAVEGRSTYDALVRLACGEDPAWRRGERQGVAISYALRVFADAYVTAVPEPADGLEVLARRGLRLSEQGTNDPHSYRLAIFSEWGATREEALERCRARAAALHFGLQPV
jgi:ATP-grasp domain-containing protein